MYLHIGQETVVPMREIVGIFDMENTTISKSTRTFLNEAERNGRVITVGDDLPKSFVVCQTEDNLQTVYISQISCATLLKRAESFRSI
ncbi:MAG: DUF370 domain-containing protein [Clostridia bacterium]|nr:DUF370 domain-containing protein [Clostridia bacterium]